MGGIVEGETTDGHLIHVLSPRRSLSANTQLPNALTVPKVHNTVSKIEALSWLPLIPIRSYKYIPAVLVAFVASVASYLILVILSIRADFGDVPFLVAMAIHFLAFIIVGFLGVFFGTLCLPETGRGTASKHLLGIGLLFAVLPSYLMLFIPLLPLAMGGLLAVLIFKKLSRDLDSIARRRRLAIILSIVICAIISIMAFLVWAGGPMTQAKVAKLLERAGGLAKVEQEANLFFERYGTNEDYLHWSDRTNFPALSALGASVSMSGASKIVIRHGPLTNAKFIFILRSAPDPNQTTTGDGSKFFTSDYIQAATNIFIMK